MFCRVRWEANDYGTIRWQLMVMQAATPLDDMQRIPGVRPGARLLLHAEGENTVRAVLERIDGIEGQGIVAIDVSPAYRSEEHTSELQTTVRNSIDAFCLKQIILI